MNIYEISKYLVTLLDLELKPMGVKFLFDDEEYDGYKCEEVNGRVQYCAMLKKSLSKGLLKATIKNINCPGAARALGLMKIPNEFIAGKYGEKLGIYQNRTVSKYVANNFVYCSHIVKGFVVGKLEDFTQEPDVCILITNPYQTMRISQAYTCNNGIKTDFSFSGNQAFCSELTAIPYENNTINISMLCAGTRAVAKWKENEMGFGAPYHLMEDIINGLKSTLTPIESNEKKQRITELMKENSIGDIEFEFNKNYYRGVYKLREE